MILRRDGASHPEGTVAIPVSVTELGRSLRRERMRQGMNMADVEAGTGLPASQIDALEAGTVGRLPDRVVSLKALRRYADFLGLPAEQYVMSLVDNWPILGASADQTAPGAPALRGPALGPATQVVGVGPGELGGPGGAGELVGAGGPGEAGGPGGAGEPTMFSEHPGLADAAATSRISAVSPGAAPGRDPVARRVGSRTGSLERSSGASAPVVGPTRTAGPSRAVPAVPAAVVADTGVVPKVGPGSGPPPGIYSSRSPLGLRVAVVVVSLAIVAGLAGLVIHKVRPTWLSHLGLTTAGTVVPPPASSHPGRAASKTSPTTPPAPVFTVVSTTGTAATFHVRAARFTVTVTALGNPSWVQATQAQQATPVFAATLTAGKSTSFVVTRSLSVEVGSAAARVFVKVGTKLVGFYFPKVAPFTMTFHAVT